MIKADVEFTTQETLRLMKHLQITEVIGLFNFWQYFFYTNSEAQIKKS